MLRDFYFWQKSRLLKSWSQRSRQDQDSMYFALLTLPNCPQAAWFRKGRYHVSVWPGRHAFLNKMAARAQLSWGQRNQIANTALTNQPNCTCSQPIVKKLARQWSWRSAPLIWTTWTIMLIQSAQVDLKWQVSSQTLYVTSTQRPQKLRYGSSLVFVMPRASSFRIY